MIVQSVMNVGMRMYGVIIIRVAFAMTMMSLNQRKKFKGVIIMDLLEKMEEMTAQMVDLITENIVPSTITFADVEEVEF